MNPLSQLKTFVVGSIQIIIILAIAFFIWKGQGTISDYWNRIQHYEELEKANTALVGELKTAKEHMKAMDDNFMIAITQVQELGEENAKLKEDADNAKSALRKKDISGNFQNWIQTNPDDFRNRATDASNRVLATIGTISSRDQGSGKGANPNKGTLSDAINPKNTSTNNDMASSPGGMD